MRHVAVAIGAQPNGVAFHLEWHGAYLGQFACCLDDAERARLDDPGMDDRAVELDLRVAQEPDHLRFAETGQQAQGQMTDDPIAAPAKDRTSAQVSTDFRLL